MPSRYSRKTAGRRVEKTLANTQIGQKRETDEMEVKGELQKRIDPEEMRREWKRNH